MTRCHIRGAEFGRAQFENVACASLDDNPRMREQFELGYDIPRIVSAIQFETGEIVSEGSGYPVGKVNTLDLHPLSFREFLVATGNRALCDLVDTGDASLINSFSSKFVSLFRQCYCAGGMPEAVSAFLERGLLEDAREV